jgi:AraC-like DNA-binding protein
LIERSTWDIIYLKKGVISPIIAINASDIAIFLLRVYPYRQEGFTMQATHQVLKLEGTEKFLIYYSTDSLYPPHWHEALELVYALEDGIGIGINSGHIMLRKGEIAVINSHEIHSFQQQERPLKRLIIQIDPSYSHTYSQIMSQKKFKKNLISMKPGERDESILYEKLQEGITGLIEEREKKEPDSYLAMEALVSQILVYLIRGVELGDLSVTDTRKAGLRRDRLKRVFSYIEENYTHSIDLSEISKVSHFSTYHFTRFFKESTGITFNQYLNRLRISKSLPFLADTNKSVTEIAYETGFGSIKTFNRIFRSLNGCSPSQYRKQYILLEKK